MSDSRDNEIKILKIKMKEIIDSIDKLTESIDKNNKIIEGLYSMFNYKTTNKQELSNEERYNIKGEKNWEAFVANALINKQYDSDGKSLIYNNILQKAAIVGKTIFRCILGIHR